jgi:hypothetical protein
LKLRYKLAELLVAMLISLVLAELTVRVVAPQPLSGIWQWPGEGGYRLNRVGGTARHEFGERVVRYRFNEYRMRGGPLPATGIRVLVLGDSCTFGWLLEEKDTYIARLAAAADGEFGSGTFQFLNGGCGGWGAAHYTAFLEDWGPKIKPNVVLAFLNFDDIDRVPGAALYTLADGDPPQAQRTVSAPGSSGLKRAVRSSAVYQAMLEHSHLAQLVHKLIAFGPAGPPPTPAEASATTNPAGAASVDNSQQVLLAQAIFRRLDKWCEDHDATLLVVTPGLNVWGSRDGTATADFLAGADDFFHEIEVPFKDPRTEVEDEIRAAGGWGEFVIPGEGHPNEAGAELIATHVWPWLREQLRPLALRGHPSSSSSQVNR